jgi:ABC-type nitrate/sulfonate/bicarbonate transport system substrate-binding protein
LTATSGEIVAKALPDGYTLLRQGNNLWLGPLLQKTPYDPFADFIAITVTDESPNILVVHPSLPVKSVKELIALAKARPGTLHYASSGVGGFPHMNTELFKLMAGVDLVHVPFKGGGPALINANLQRRSIVGVAGTLNRMVMKIMAAPQIKSPNDIRGKRIAITRYGTTSDFSARLFLKNWAPSAEKEAVILQVGSIPNVLASLQSGASQLGALSPPAHLQAEKAGFTELMDLSKREIFYPYTYVTVSAPLCHSCGGGCGQSLPQTQRPGAAAINTASHSRSGMVFNGPRS